MFLQRSLAPLSFPWAARRGFCCLCPPSAVPQGLHTSAWIWRGMAQIGCRWSCWNLRFLFAFPFHDNKPLPNSLCTGWRLSSSDCPFLSPSTPPPALIATYPSHNTSRGAEGRIFAFCDHSESCSFPPPLLVFNYRVVFPLSVCFRLILCAGGRGCLLGRDRPTNCVCKFLKNILALLSSNLPYYSSIKEP